MAPLWIQVAHLLAADTLWVALVVLTARLTLQPIEMDSASQRKGPVIPGPFLFPIPCFSVLKSWMMMAFPAQVPRRLMHGFRNIAEVGRHVVLKALATNVLQQLLQLRNFRHARAAKSFQRIVGEFTLACIAAHHAAPIVGGVARIGHGARLYAPHASAEGIFLAHRAGNDSPGSPSSLP